MTETMGTTPGGASPSGDANTRDVAKDEAKGVAQDAAQAGKQTAETAKQQVGEVAGEAKTQAKVLLEETRSQLTSQGTAQQEKAASGLRSLADELSGMVSGTVSEPGLASELAQQASDRVRTVADMLENSSPSDLLDEVRRFARNRPGVFLLSAVALGFLGGRLTRGVAEEVREDRQAEQQHSGGYYGTAAPTVSGYAGGMAATPSVPVSTGLPDGPVGTPGYSVPPSPAGDSTAQFTPTAPETGLGEASTDQMPSEFGAQGTSASGNRTTDEGRF